MVKGALLDTITHTRKTEIDGFWLKTSNFFFFSLIKPNDSPPPPPMKENVFKQINKMSNYKKRVREKLPGSGNKNEKKGKKKKNLSEPSSV